ncbi:MAG: hypothetical protein CMK59_03425 [Proteobacteria bacterium]|nr:hypothetical protein [Pseudomonadota bacterium]
MGFFDFLFGTDEKSTLKKHAKRVNNLNAQFEERQASAQWLAEQGSPEAISALLNRFSLAYEHNMKDAEEKDFILSHLRFIGESALPTIKEWIKTNDKFARPLTLVEHHEGEEGVVDLLMEIVRLENDQFKPEKKRQGLIHLAKFKDNRIPSVAIPELDNFDEGVRYAAVEALSNQEGEDVREALSAALSNPNEESNRYRVRIAEVFLNQNWQLSNPDAIQDNPPVGFVVIDSRIARA